MIRLHVLLLCILCCLAPLGQAIPAYAQTSGLKMTIAPSDIGLMGMVRPGTWTPIRVQLENHWAQPRQVRLQWILKDGDEDQVHAERRITLTPGREQQTFIYAATPAKTNRRTKWRIRVIDDLTANPLAAQEIRPARIVSSYTGVICTTSINMMGLQPYSSRSNGSFDLGAVTQHEPIQVVTGLSASRLPDRWYGLELTDAIIWTPSGSSDGPDGTSDTITPSTAKSLKTWIHRGGHLVIVLPMVGDPWDELPIDNLLPPFETERVYAIPAPRWLGTPITSTPPKIDAQIIKPADQSDGRWGNLLLDNRSRSLVSVCRVGFGRITLIGIDLADQRLARAGLPNSKGLWSTVFGWRSPAYDAAQIEYAVERRHIAAPNSRYLVQLDRFIERLVAMRETASPALLASLLVFGVYWLSAGPVSYAVLRTRGWQRHSWMVFAGVVAVFTMVCWGGAMALRPIGTQVAHFSVIDAQVNTPVTRMQSWLSLFVPRHGDVRVSLSDNPTGQNTLSSPGWSSAPGQSGFVDPQWYPFNTAAPDEMNVPIRATAKQFKADYLGLADKEGGYAADAMIMPTSPLAILSGWPKGTLTHNLPGTLTNVRILYCPGRGHQPWVWQPQSIKKGWPPGQTLTLVPPKQAERLVRKGQVNIKPRQWSSEGYLGLLIDAKTGQTLDLHPSIETIIASNDVVQAIEMLSFYDALPPPDFRNTEFIDRSATYARSLARGIDITGATLTRSLMIIGHIDNAPLPVPLLVEGNRVDSKGWTVVRWSSPIQPATHSQ